MYCTWKLGQSTRHDPFSPNLHPFPLLFFQLLFSSQPCVASQVLCDLLNPLPPALASRSHLSVRVVASLLPAAGQGCWSSRSSSAALVLQGARAGLAGRHRSTAGALGAILLAARAGPEPRSAPAGLSHQGRKIPVAPWPSLFLRHRRQALK